MVITVVSMRVMELSLTQIISVITMWKRHHVHILYLYAHMHSSLEHNYQDFGYSHGKLDEYSDKLSPIIGF